MSTDSSDAGPTEQRTTEQRTTEQRTTEQGIVDERYAALSLAESTTIVYDVSNHRAWIQADHAVSLDGMP